VITGSVWHSNFRLSPTECPNSASTFWNSALKPPFLWPIKRIVNRFAGVFMAPTRQNQIYISDSHEAQAALTTVISSGVAQASSSSTKDSLTILAKLLREDPIELGQVCDEIRSHPGLEELTVHLGKALALSPDWSPANLEEVAIQLGVDRLRIVFRVWLSILESSAELDQLPGSPKATPEALYLAAFLRELGVNGTSSVVRLKSPGFSPEVDAEMRPALVDVLVRDFLSLIPFLDPSLLRSDSTLLNSSPGVCGRKEEE